eukprot:3573262-Pyramimonas_sp.AAC.1
MFLIRAGCRDPVTVVALGPLRLGYGENIRRVPRLGVNCEDVSGGNRLPMGSAAHVFSIRAGHRDPVTVVTFGPLRPEYGGALQAGA